mgnify:CR=1 FL=1
MQLGHNGWMTHLQLPTSAASERNKLPILEVLHSWLGHSGAALEIASGTGQHVACFAAALPAWHWQPSDLDDALFKAILQRCQQAGLSNVQPPILLDVRAPQWPLPSSNTAVPSSANTLSAEANGANGKHPRFDLIYCANMLHIAPWECCAGLMQGASRHLTEEGLLVTYGPYLEDAVPPAPSNLAFDADLRQRDPAWGIRHLNDVCAEAEAAGLQLVQRVTMPANNLLLGFGRKTPALQTR